VLGVEIDQLAKAKARLTRARDAYLVALQGQQNPARISDQADRQKATLAKEEYEQATKAFIDLTLEAGRKKRPAQKSSGSKREA
jgi:hypothetical protein